MPRKVGCFLNISEIASDIHNLVHVCRLKSFNFPLSCSWSVQSVLHDFSVDMKFLLLRIETQNSQRALLSSLGVFLIEEARSLLLAYLLCRIFQGLARGFSTLTDTHRLFWWMVVRRDCWDSSVIAWPSGGVATCTHLLLCSVLTLSTAKCSVCVSASRGGGGGTFKNMQLLLVGHWREELGAWSFTFAWTCDFRFPCGIVALIFNRIVSRISGEKSHSRRN